MTKTSVFITLTTASMFAVTAVFGHGETQTKGSCSWGWRYKAKARVNNGPGITAGSQQACGGSVSRTVSNPCAWQSSTNNSGSSSFAGAVFATPWLCGRGYANSEMFYDMMKYKMPVQNDTAERVSLTNSSISFLPHKIKINNVLGFIEAKDDMRAFYQVQVWLPNHDMDKMIEDTITDANEIIWTGKVSIVNSQMILEGGFYNEKFDESMNGTKKRVSFNGKNFNIQLPNWVNTNDVVVIVTCDGGFNEANTFRMAQQTTEDAIKDNKIKFNVFPNPISSEFNVNFMSNKDGKVEIKIYSTTGQIIKSIINNVAKKDEEINIKVDVKTLNLSSGIYFIYVDNDESIYLKKIVIE